MAGPSDAAAVARTRLNRVAASRQQRNQEWNQHQTQQRGRQEWNRSVGPRVVSPVTVNHQYGGRQRPPTKIVGGINNPPNNFNNNKNSKMTMMPRNQVRQRVGNQENNGSSSQPINLSQPRQPLHVQRQGRPPNQGQPQQQQQRQMFGTRASRLQRVQQPTSGAGPLLSAERFSMVSAPPTTRPPPQQQQQQPQQSRQQQQQQQKPTIKPGLPKPQNIHRNASLHAKAAEALSNIRPNKNVDDDVQLSRQAAAKRTAMQQQPTTIQPQQSSRSEMSESRPLSGTETPSTASLATNSSDSPERRDRPPVTPTRQAASLEAREKKLNSWKNKGRYMEEESLLKEGIRQCIQTAKCVGVNVKDCIMVSADVYQQECITQHTNRGDDDEFLAHVYSSDGKPDIQRQPSVDHSLLSQTLDEEETDELINPPPGVRRSTSPQQQGRDDTGLAAGMNQQRPRQQWTDPSMLREAHVITPQGKQSTHPDDEYTPMALAPPLPAQPEDATPNAKTDEQPAQPNIAESLNLQALRLSIFETESGSTTTNTGSSLQQQEAGDSNRQLPDDMPHSTPQKELGKNEEKQDGDGDSLAMYNKYFGMDAKEQAALSSVQSSMLLLQQPFAAIPPLMGRPTEQQAATPKKSPRTPPEAGVEVRHEDFARVKQDESPEALQSELKYIKRALDLPSPQKYSNGSPQRTARSPEAPAEMGEEVQHEDYNRVQVETIEALETELAQTKQKLQEALTELETNRSDSDVKKKELVSSTDKMFRERVEVEEQLRQEMKSNRKLAEQVLELENETRTLRTSLERAQSGSPPMTAATTFSSSESGLDSDQGAAALTILSEEDDGNKAKDGESGIAIDFKAPLAERRKALRQKELRLSKLVETLRAQRDGDSSIVESDKGGENQGGEEGVAPFLPEDFSLQRKKFDPKSKEDKGDNPASPEVTSSDPREFDAIELTRSVDGDGFAQALARNSAFNVGSPARASSKQSSPETTPDRKRRLELESQLEKVQSELSEARRKLDAAVSEREAAESKTSALEKEANAAKLESKTLRHETADLKRRVMSLWKEKSDGNVALQSEIKVLQDKLNEADEEKKQRAAEKVEAKQDLFRRQIQSERLKDDVRKFKEEISELKRNLQSALDEVNDRSDEKAELERALASSKGETQKLRGDVAKYMNELERLKLVNSSNAKVTAKEAASLQEEVRLLKEKLAQSNAEVISQAKEHLIQRRELEAELQQTRDSAQILQRRVISMDDEIANAENEAQILRIRLQEEGSKRAAPSMTFGSFFAPSDSETEGPSQQGMANKRHDRASVIERLRKTLDSTLVDQNNNGAV